MILMRCGDKATFERNRRVDDENNNNNTGEKEEDEKNSFSFYIDVFVFYTKARMWGIKLSKTKQMPVEINNITLKDNHH